MSHTGPTLNDKAINLDDLQRRTMEQAQRRLLLGVDVDYDWPGQDPNMPLAERLAETTRWAFPKLGEVLGTPLVPGGIPGLVKAAWDEHGGKTANPRNDEGQATAYPQLMRPQPAFPAAVDFHPTPFSSIGHPNQPVANPARLHLLKPLFPPGQ